MISINCIHSRAGQCDLHGGELTRERCNGCADRVYRHTQFIRVDVPDVVMICAARHLEWPVAAWQQIEACPLIGSKFRVPRELFDRIKHHHNPPE